jgi:DNA polymerase-3 subunit epsilon
VDLATPLYDVTFVVVDCETTGGSPSCDAITEVGALKLRGGDLLASLDTLVNPGVPIPPMITMLTGITEAMVLPAPRIEVLLPSIAELVHGAVIVGHNIRFDISFLNAAFVTHGYPPLTNVCIDTIGLARRLVRDDVMNLKLQTLAHHYRASIEPVHRAYADAAATADVLHAMLEHAGTYGVLGLDDLVALPYMRAHPSSGKLRLTARLPRAPGVYVFRDRAGHALHVGAAANLRTRVRSFFVSDGRRAIPPVLRELAAIEHHECASTSEAEARQRELADALEPAFSESPAARLAGHANALVRRRRRGRSRRSRAQRTAAI